MGTPLAEATHLGSAEAGPIAMAVVAAAGAAGLFAAAQRRSVTAEDV